jgi:hypothetical protein
MERYAKLFGAAIVDTSVLPTLDVVARIALPTVDGSQFATLIAGKPLLEHIQQCVLALRVDDVKTLNQTEHVLVSITRVDAFERLAWVRRALEAVLDRSVPQSLAALLEP